MANTPEERLRFRAALKLVTGRYKDWVQGNPRLTPLETAHAEQLDVLVKFLDSGPFITNFTLSGKVPSGCSILGFTDLLYEPPHIYINRGQATPSTCIHETLHYLTHKEFHRLAPWRLNEGVTEYFTRKLQGTATSQDLQEFTGLRTSYDTERAKVNATRSHVKSVVVPMLPDIRNQPVQLGRARNIDFMPDPFRGKRPDDFVKRAYFRGEAEMIKLLCENCDL